MERPGFSPVMPFLIGLALGALWFALFPTLAALLRLMH